MTSDKNTRLSSNIAVLILYSLAFSLVFYSIAVKQSTFLYENDNLTQTYAWLYKQWNAIHHQEIALWDFQPGGGSSFIGELQTSAFYPLNIAFAILVQDFSLNAVNIYIIIHFVLAAFFMYLCIRDHGYSCRAAFVAGMIYSLFSISKRVYAQANIFLAMIWLPLIIVFLKRAFESRSQWYRNIYIYLTGITLGISLLAGHIQPFLHNVICMGIWTLFFSNYRKGQRTSVNGIVRNLLLLIYSGMICAVVTFGQLISTMEYISRSYRWIGLDSPIKGNEKVPAEAYLLYEIDWKYILGYIDPNYGIDEYGMTEYGSLYITIIGFVLVIISIFKLKDKVWKYSMVLVVFGLICALGDNSIIGIWICRLPLLSMIREPLRYVYITNFGTAILVALGYEVLESVVYKLKFSQEFRNVAIHIVCAAICIVICVDAWKYHGRLYEQYDVVEGAYRESAGLSYLRECVAADGGTVRIYNNDTSTLPANIGNVYPDLFTTSSHRATLGIDYYDYECRDWDVSSDNMRHLGVKYIISLTEREDEDFSLVYSDDQYYIYERKSDTSVFWNVNTDQNDMLVCDGIKAVAWNTNSVSIRGSFDEGLFVFTQANYPGWKVYVDGDEGTIETYDIFMAVVLSQGEHEIEFRYNPWWLPVWYEWLIVLIVWCVYLGISNCKDMHRMLITTV